MRMSGWAAFGLWALVGILYAFVYLAILSIGIYILVIAIVTTLAAFRNLTIWPEISGLAAGPAAMMMWIAWRNGSLNQCGPGERDGVVVSSTASWNMHSGMHLEITQSLGCTDFDAPVLMCAGIAIAVATLVAYSLCRHPKL